MCKVPPIYLINNAIKKAKKVPCRYKISAIGYDKNFNYLGTSCNSFRNIGGNGYRGVHAEERLISRYSKNLAYIFIIRTNKEGKILPIEPCSVCSKHAENMGIKIISIKK